MCAVFYGGDILCGSVHGGFTAGYAFSVDSPPFMDEWSGVTSNVGICLPWCAHVNFRVRQKFYRGQIMGFMAG